MHPGFSQDPAGVDDFEDLISLEWKNIKRLLGHGSRPHGAILVVIVSVSFNGEKRTLLFLSHEQRWLVCVTPVDTFRENAGTHTPPDGRAIISKAYTSRRFFHLELGRNSKLPSDSVSSPSRLAS